MESYSPMTTQPADWGSMSLHPALRAAMMPLTSGSSGMMMQPMWSGMSMPWQMGTSVPTGTPMMSGMQMHGIGVDASVWAGVEAPMDGTAMPDMDAE